MRKKFFFIGVILIFVVQIIALVVFAVQTPEPSQDAVTVNEIVQSVTRDFDALDKHKNDTSFDYVVLSNDGTVLYKTKSGLSDSVNAAIMHRDSIIDISIDNEVVGKVIVYNDEAQTLKSHKQTAVAVLSTAIAVECAICICYAVYLHFTIVKPFRKLKGFAERVSVGNLDIPLEMDKRNIFGAFTESFDIMRSELKKARIAEAQAQLSKKELVAKLSHDIKTPIASIKAVSEVGLAVAVNDKDRANYEQIVGKADQINTLITNLFTATLEDLQQLIVTPAHISSRQVKDLLVNADYLRRADVPELPECLLYADRLRLQQVFDNIFSNSYKYANTEITVGVQRRDDSIGIVVEDFGGGVDKDDLPTLKEKFKRGSNSAKAEGVGLGLYISDYFMKEMNGELIVENGTHGLKVTIVLSMSGKI